MPTDAQAHGKHGLAANARAPASPDWTIDQDWDHYSAAEHALWTTLYQRQARLLPARACDAFLQGLRDLPMEAAQIPDFRRVNAVLQRRTGWRLVAVPGLIPDAVFFQHLAERRFPAGNFIRRADQLDYLEEPDVFHDLFGHVPMLMNPAMADFMQAYGLGGLRAQQLGCLEQLARVYWYTVEFGLLQEGGALRIYGAGIASSFTETHFALEDASPNRLGFDLARVMRTRYRIDDFQESYFVIPDLDALLELAQIDFKPLYAQVAVQATHQPGELLPTDLVFQCGSGGYHRARRQLA
jgi:phenylalanine-4-hydroxylase